MGGRWPCADHRAWRGYEGQAPGSALPGHRVVGSLWAQGLPDVPREMTRCQLLLLKSVAFCTPEVRGRTERAGRRSRGRRRPAPSPPGVASAGPGLELGAVPSRPAWCDLTGGFLSLCSVSPLHLSLRAGVRERPVRECGDPAWPLVPRVYSVPEDVGPGKGGHPVRGPGASWGTHGPCAGRRGAWWPEACRPRGAGPLRLHGGRGVPGLEKRRMPLAQKPQGRGRPSGLLWSQNEGGQPLASHWPPRRPSLAGRLSAVAEPWPSRGRG